MNIQERMSAIGERAQPDPLAPLFTEIMAAKKANPDLISLAVGAPDSDLLPADIAQALFTDALTTYGPGVLNYTKPEGMPPFATTVQARLQDQGVVFDPEVHGLLVTSGGMEAISMASEMVLDPGDTVLVESPAFAGAISVFQLWGANVVHVNGDADGMTPEALGAAIKAFDPKLVLLMPDGQNPGGSTMPKERRKAIASLLQEHGVLAIEDGAYAPLNYASEQLSPLQAEAPGHVMYASSVSKYLFPAARIGALVAPKTIISAAAAAKSSINMQASGLLQAMTERYLSSDRTYLQDYLPGLLKEYAARRDAMVAALEKHFADMPGFAWNKPTAGMFLMLRHAPQNTAEPRVNFTDLSPKAIANGVAYVPESMFYAPNDAARGHHGARLNFASTPAERMDEAIRRLAQTITQG